MALFAGAVSPVPILQFSDEDGVPLVAGQLFSYVAGTTTPQPVYHDVDLTPGMEYTNPIILDASGTPGGPIFLLPTGYKFVLTDADNVPVWTADDIEDIGQTFASNFGVVQSAGGKNVTSGYTLLASDRSVSVSSTGGANPCIFNLIAASLATQMVFVQDVGSVDVAITPNGADTINSVAAAYTLAAGSSPVFSAVLLLPDGISNWQAFLFAS